MRVVRGFLFVGVSLLEKAWIYFIINSVICKFFELEQFFSAVKLKIACPRDRGSSCVKVSVYCTFSGFLLMIQSQLKWHPLHIYPSKWKRNINDVVLQNPLELCLCLPFLARGARIYRLPTVTSIIHILYMYIILSSTKIVRFAHLVYSLTRPHCCVVHTYTAKICVFFKAFAYSEECIIIFKTILFLCKEAKLDFLLDNFIYFMTTNIPAIMQINFPIGEDEYQQSGQYISLSLLILMLLESANAAMLRHRLSFFLHRYLFAITVNIQLSQDYILIY